MQRKGNIGRDQDEMQPRRSHQWHFLPLRPSPTIPHLPVMPTMTPSGDELIYLLGQSLKIQLLQAMPSPTSMQRGEPLPALSYSSQLRKKSALLFEFRVSVHRPRDSSIHSGCGSSHPHSLVVLSWSLSGWQSPGVISAKGQKVTTQQSL